MDLKKHIRSIPDYPKKGILFRDITTLIKDAKAFKYTNDKIVEIAKTIEERRIGLMYRKKLLNNEGMLFIFPREKIIQLWMKNTYIPLDVIFISENKVIVDIKKNMEKLSETIVKTKVKSRYALEFNAGLINKLDIEIGDKILFNE